MCVWVSDIVHGRTFPLGEVVMVDFCFVLFEVFVESKTSIWYGLFEVGCFCFIGMDIE